MELLKWLEKVFKATFDTSNKKGWIGINSVSHKDIK